MKFAKRIPLIVLILALLVLGGCTAEEPTEEPTETEAPQPTRQTTLEDGTRTIGFYQNGEPMQSIPDMETSGFFGTVTECNNTCHMATYLSTTKEEFERYADLLVNHGFSLEADSGENGINDDVFYKAFQKDDMTIHLVYQARQGTTSVIAGEGENLSPHLAFSESYLEGFRDGIKNSLTMLDQATGQALGMIFQLRNGHFILIDGGRAANAQNVLKYLKNMAPEGEKPVVEGWFLTHSHGDHYGVMAEFADHKEMCSEIIVNGLYYNQPNAEHVAKTNSSPEGFTAIRLLSFTLQDENGESPKIYRTVMGQRYYFGDIVMDMICSTEFVPFYNSDGDFNETDTVYMFDVDGQKALINGDSEMGCMYLMMNSFRRNYFTVDIFQVTHHGYSSLREFFDYMTYIKTAINPNRILVDSILDNGATRYLMDSSCEEFYYSNGGTIRMDFPYEVGQMVILGDDFETYPTWQQIMLQKVYYLYLEG